ncbi:hypothetical protein [Labrys sp. ZIDIC5]|uniref:hypothetical protein n=1 Tax=Labrys sedimenti TaxID=3106036 RepID=UPI002ACA57FD|nr:hypothetical protein [Labrys sp. ZIDIC5]MDZ5451394.1 hypothetical protein [Labrys sp. ZIDIC5]
MAAESTKAVLDFMGFLAVAHRAFVEAMKEARKKQSLHNLEISIVPSDNGPIDYTADGKVLFLYLNADIKAPIASRQQALGMQFLMRHTMEQWQGEAEIGWSSNQVGWDVFDSREFQAPTIEAFIENAPDHLDWLGKRFIEEVAKLPG